MLRRALRASQAPAAGLLAMLAGIALGALLPDQLRWLADGTRAALGLFVLAAPFVIFLTLAPALLGLLRARAAGRLVGAVVAAFLAGAALAGLLAALLVAPALQLPLAPSGPSRSGAGLGAQSFLVTLWSPSFTAVWYAGLVALLLHAARRSPLRAPAAATARVLERIGVQGVERLGQGLRAVMAPILFAAGVFVPASAGDALRAGEQALGSAAAAALAWYAASVALHALVLALLVALATPLVCRAARFPMRRFASEYLAYVFPFAFGTASSAAAMPINLERARDGLGVRPEVRDLVVPLGATLNRTGSMVSAVVLAAVAALLVGYRPSLVELLLLLPPLTLVVSTAPPIPAGTAVVAPPVVLSVLPIPPEAQAAFVGVYFAFGVGLSDQLRTAVNAVSGGWHCLLFERWFPRLQPGAAAAEP
jgi:Na+/H+-dicarboxylate symporter